MRSYAQVGQKRGSDESEHEKKKRDDKEGEKC